MEDVNVSAERGASFAYICIGSQVNLLVFDCPPQALDEHIVPPSRFAIHADGDLVFYKEAGNAHSRKLTAVIGVEDLRLAVPVNRLLNRLDAKIRLKRDRQTPGQNLTAEPIDDRGKIDKAPRHRDVVDIHGPDLIGTTHNKIA